MRLQTWLGATLLLGACVASYGIGDDQAAPKKKAEPAAKSVSGPEHASMLKEHQKAHSEHDAALSQLSKWRVEHRRALAALASLQAKILEHDASVEELAEHARVHEDHIRHHEDEIHDHEAGGSGADHAHLADHHKKLLKEHQDFQKAMNSVEDNHEHLMLEITKLAESLKKHSEKK